MGDATFTTRNRRSGLKEDFLIPASVLILLGSVVITWVNPLLENYMPWILLAVALSIFGLLTMVRPEWALLATVAYIPFESSRYRPIELPASLTVIKILGFLLLACFFFSILFRRRPFRLLDDPQDFAVLALGAVLLFSGVESLLPTKTLSSTFRMFRLFAFYFAAKNLITSLRLMRQAMWCIVLGGTYAAGFGLNSFFELRRTRLHDMRVGGVYMDPNDFAAAMVVVIVVGLYLLQATRQRLLRLLLAVCVGTCTVALVLSASRGGLLALGVVGILYIWRQPKRGRLMIATAALVVITFPLWPASVTDRVFVELGNSANPSGYSLSAELSARRRVSYISFGGSLVTQHPVLGVGYGLFSQLYYRSPFAWYENPLTEGERVRVAHNAYLEVAVDTGLVGLVAYLLPQGIAWLALRRAARRLARGTTAWAVANAFELALVGIMLSNVFLSNQDSKYLWLAVGMSSAVSYYARQTVPRAGSD